MLKPSRPSGALIVLSCTLAVVGVACSSINPTKTVSTYSPSEKPPTNPVTAGLKPNATPLPLLSTPFDGYQQALDNAGSAYIISQSAQSADDWRLVVSRWQEAIALLKAVPASSPNNAIAKNKIFEYQRNLAYARDRATSPSPGAKTEAIVEIPAAQVPILTRRKIVKPVAPLPTAAPIATSPVATPPVATSPVAAANKTPATAPTVAVRTPVLPSPVAETQRVFQTPIKRRQDGIPVIEVTFNGTETFEMIVDTGASDTLITEQMGEALSLMSVGKAKAKTATGEVVEFLLGNVKSIEVGGVVAKDMVVAIGGPEVEIGLLGHDFFGNYDITIKQDVVEFRER